MDNEHHTHEDAYLAFIGDIACELSFYDAQRADRLKAVEVVLADYGVDRPGLAESIADADPKLCTEPLDAERVRHILREHNVGPEEIDEVPGGSSDKRREKFYQHAKMPTTLPAAEV
jgi:hypothetical protein